MTSGSRRTGPARVAADVMAGLQGAISSVPGGMATAALAGVHPIQGLYACLAGPIAGSLTARTRLMIVTTTGAVALAAGSALHNVPADSRPAAMPVLTLLVAAALVAAGLLRLGRYTRFVSHSVMIGFLTGVSVNIICGQVAGLTGAKTSGQIAVLRAVSVLVHPGRINLAALLTGLAALAILVVLFRTRFAPGGPAARRRATDRGGRGSRGEQRGPCARYRTHPAGDPDTGAA